MDVRLAFFVLVAACSFSPEPQLRSDGSPHDGNQIDARLDGPRSDGPQSDAPKPGCPPDYVRLGQLSSSYKIYGWSSTKGRSYANAQAMCTSAGTHLAIINSLEEGTALWEAIPLNSRSPYFWEGISDAGTEGTWNTVLGQPAAYLPWAPGQPSGGSAANCALANRDNIYDWFCGSRYPFACECE